MLKLLLQIISFKVNPNLILVRQKLVFEVYHMDKPPKLVGKAESTVGQIFGSPSNGLKNGMPKSTENFSHIIDY